MMTIKDVAAKIITLPLDIVASDRSNALAKLVAAVAIAVFTACSLGYYAFFAYNYLADQKKIYSLLPQLTDAVDLGDIVKVNQLFIDCPALRQHINNDPLLHEAVRKQDTAMVNILLDNGADLRVRQSYRGTPLKVAVKCGHLDMVRLLLANNRKDDALVNCKDSILYEAAYTHMEPKEDHLEIIKALVEAGADIVNEHHPEMESAIGGVSRTFMEKFPEKTGETIDWMRARGARFTPGDDKLRALRMRATLQRDLFYPDSGLGKSEFCPY